MEGRLSITSAYFWQLQQQVQLFSTWLCLILYQALYMQRFGPDFLMSECKSSHWTPLCLIKAHHLTSSTMMCSLQMLSLLSRQRLPEDSGKSMHSLFQVNFQHRKWGDGQIKPLPASEYSVQLRCSWGDPKVHWWHPSVYPLCALQITRWPRDKGLRVNCYLASYWPQPFVPNKLRFAHVLGSFQPVPHILECSQKKQQIRTKPPYNEYIEIFILS